LLFNNLRILYSIFRPPDFDVLVVAHRYTCFWIHWAEGYTIGHKHILSLL